MHTTPQKLGALILGTPLLPRLGTWMLARVDSRWSTHAAWWWTHILRPLHLATFYLGGAYLDLGRRLLGLRYLLLRRLTEGSGEREEWEATSAVYALAGLLLLGRTVLVAARRLWTRGSGPSGADEEREPAAGEKGTSTSSSDVESRDG